MESLKVDVEHHGEETRLALAGRVDETAGSALEDAFRDLRQLVKMDLERVTRINSYGIGLLMRNLNRVSRDHAIEFERCSEVVVDQFQMLDFSTYGRITSFYARYVCDRCNREPSVLLDVATDIKVENGEVSARTYRCKCGGEMTVDDPLEFVLDHI
jgi:ABC-type transporter Mla MlaB component